MTNMKDFLVVGGGIAGLAAAELLQRSGASVVLLEKNDRLCGESSAEQQGWFHTGALYAGLPIDSYFRAMVGNIDDLVDYYRGFPNMNLRVEKHIFATQRHGWFNNRNNFYVYVAASGVSWGWKLPWSVALYRARRRMAWFESIDASRSLSRQMGFEATPTKYVVHESALGVALPHTAMVLKSRDRSMNTNLIVGDLVRSFLGSGGTIRTNADVTRIERGLVVVGEGDTAEQVEGRHVIVATGRGSERFFPKLKTVASPLLVVRPALTDVSFIRMSPHMHDTLNHIYHRGEGFDYSLLGNAVYCPVEKLNDERVAEMKAHMLRMASSAFGDISNRKSALCIGYKTELTSSSSLRNYLYHIVDTDAFTLALPGKFSLCFSLATNLCRHFGIEPASHVSFDPSHDVSHLVSPPNHLKRARELMPLEAPRLPDFGEYAGALPRAKSEPPPRRNAPSQWPPVLD